MKDFTYSHPLPRMRPAAGDVEQYRSAIVFKGKLKASPSGVYEALRVARYAPLKPLLADMIAARRSIADIAQNLTAMGILTPKGKPQWHPMSVSRALTACGLKPLGRWG
jgi:Recombinase